MTSDKLSDDIRWKRGSAGAPQDDDHYLLTGWATGNDPIVLRVDQHRTDGSVEELGPPEWEY